MCLEIAKTPTEQDPEANRVQKILALVEPDPAGARAWPGLTDSDNSNKARRILQSLLWNREQIETPRVSRNPSRSLAMLESPNMPVRVRYQSSDLFDAVALVKLPTERNGSLFLLRI